ncbi:MAG: hypothetical protein ACFFD8_08625 [Candidatus Thorarchaeota archaeon]
MKYQDRFGQLEELGNPSMGRFMLSEVLTKMAITCKECQKDRMRCTIKPRCPDRIFLNILITLGAKTSDFPSFCYQVHLRNFQSYLQSGAKRDHPHEPRIPLSYFRRYVQFKKEDSETNFEAFKEYLENATKVSVHGYAIDHRWYFGLGKGILIVDLRRGLVSLDPGGDIVQREALEPLINFLMMIYNLRGEILKDMQDTWYIRVPFPKIPDVKVMENVQPQLNELEKIWAFVRLNTTDNKTQILVGLDPPPERSIRLQGLRRTIEILGEISKVIPKTSKASETKKEKPEATT